MGVAIGAGGAEAAPARIRFQVESKRYSEALLDLAQQANVTLIGAGACEGSFAGRINGTMTLEQALSRLLAAAPCGWKVVAPGAVEITPPPRAVVRAAPPTVVSEVMVTATKRPRNPRELAVAVSAVSGKDLKAAGASDVGEAAGQLVGVLATNMGPGRNKLLLRGLSDGAYTGRTRSTVATYLDDIPLNYNAPDPDLRLVDVERVEVARGPQGALYGSGAMSGVYRIVARKPVLNDLAAEARGSAAATSDGAPSWAAEGFVNVPVWGDLAALRIAAYEEVQGGYLNDINLKRDDVDETRRRGGRVTLLVRPHEDWTVMLTGAGQHLKSGDTHYTEPGMGLKRANRVPEPHVNDITLGSATVKGSWGALEFTSSSGYVRHASSSYYDATKVRERYTAHGETAAYSERSRTEMFVQDLFVTSRGAGRLEWLAGVYGSITKTHTPTELLARLSFSPDVMVYSDDRHDRIEEVAAYAEVAYEFAPGWTAAVGGRLFSHHTHTRSQVVSEQFEPRSLDREMDFSSFSPKISVQKEFGSDDLVYAVITEGHRAGGVNTSGARPLEPRELENYTPDRMRNHELGVKLTAWDNRLALNAAAFYAVWKNIQTDQYRLSGIPFTTNAGDADIYGLETELAFRWTDALTVQLNGRASHADTSNPNPHFAQDLADELPGAPTVSGAALVTYERPLRGGWSVRLTGETSYVGRSRLTWDHTPAPKMGGYVRTRLLAELSRRNMGVQVFVTNPTDAFSDTYAFGNPFNPDRVRQITPQRPRTVGITLHASY